MSEKENAPDNSQETKEKELEKRLETLGWALFLIMTGGLFLIPSHLVPPDTWLIGVGLIMLGLNAYRYSRGLKVNNFTVFLGVLALGFGLSSFLYVNIPIIPLLLIFLGAKIIYSVDKKQS
jgi:hypothetical protein